MIIIKILFAIVVGVVASWVLALISPMQAVHILAVVSGVGLTGAMAAFFVGFSGTLFLSSK